MNPLFSENCAGAAASGAPNLLGKAHSQNSERARKALAEAKCHPTLKLLRPGHPALGSAA
ncbi:hypothetical protein IIA28_15595 [candidate division KSB1 bacterium]|nr:hypothetical protein [candidate division KSB1 bacterium]